MDKLSSSETLARCDERKKKKERNKNIHKLDLQRG